jgi:hypothetical protein
MTTTRTGPAALAILAVMAAAPGSAGAESAYQDVVDLRAEGPDFVVVHHHDWSRATREHRQEMIAGSQDPFGPQNDYAHVSFYARDGKTLLKRMPSPALTWLGLSADAKYVVGLSSVKLDNPVQLVVYDPTGKLLLQRHIAPRVACLTPERYGALRRRFPAPFKALGDHVWSGQGKVYVDYGLPDMADRLGDLWAELFAAECASPFSSRFTESMTNFVFWFDEQNPQPVVIERDGQPAVLLLRDPKGEPLEIPFQLDPPPAVK